MVGKSTCGSGDTGRAVYATGSNEQAARLAGLDTARVTFAVFAVAAWVLIRSSCYLAAVWASVTPFFALSNWAFVG